MDSVCGCRSLKNKAVDMWVLIVKKQKLPIFDLFFNSTVSLVIARKNNPPYMDIIGV